MKLSKKYRPGNAGLFLKGVEKEAAKGSTGKRAAIKALMSERQASPQAAHSWSHKRSPCHGRDVP